METKYSVDYKGVGGDKQKKTIVLYVTEIQVLLISK